MAEKKERGRQAPLFHYCKAAPMCESEASGAKASVAQWDGGGEWQRPEPTSLAGRQTAVEASTAAAWESRPEHR